MTPAPRYKVVESDDLAGLELEVNKLLHTGIWVLQGGVSHVISDGQVYSQAMVRTTF